MHQTLKQHILNLVLSAMFLAVGIILPFFTGQIPQVGSMLLPMHLPVLLCGLICGWQYGGAVGFILPLMRTAMFGMPPMITAIAMAFELAAYGAFSGLLYRLLPKRPAYIYVSLIGAMVLGRVVLGCVQFVLAGLQSTTFPLSAFWAGAVTSAIPGIICHIVLIPILVMALQRGGVVLNGAAVDAPVGPRRAVSPHGAV